MKSLKIESLAFLVLIIFLGLNVCLVEAAYVVEEGYLAVCPLRKMFYHHNLFWLFYSDGTNFVYRTSSDGQTWSAKTIVKEGITGRGPDIFFDGIVTDFLDGHRNGNGRLHCFIILPACQ